MDTHSKWFADRRNKIRYASPPPHNIIHFFVMQPVVLTNLASTRHPSDPHPLYLQTLLLNPLVYHCIVCSPLLKPTKNLHSPPLLFLGVLYIIFNPHVRLLVEDFETSFQPTEQRGNIVRRAPQTINIHVLNETLTHQFIR